MRGFAGNAGLAESQCVLINGCSATHIATSLLCILLTLAAKLWWKYRCRVLRIDTGTCSSRERGSIAVPMSSSSSTGTSSSSNANAARVAGLLQFARANHETNPTESLTALLEAMRLGAPDAQSGHQAAEAAMTRVRAAVGDDIADHVADVDGRRRRAVEMVRRLLDDQSTILFEQGREDILRQTMEDGSSIVCSRCGGVVPADRWRQHQQYWCDAIETEGAA